MLLLVDDSAINKETNKSFALEAGLPNAYHGYQCIRNSLSHAFVLK